MVAHLASIPMCTIHMIKRESSKLGGAIPKEVVLLHNIKNYPWNWRNIATPSTLYMKCECVYVSVFVANIVTTWRWLASNRKRYRFNGNSFTKYYVQALLSKLEWAHVHTDAAYGLCVCVWVWCVHISTLCVCVCVCLLIFVLLFNIFMAVCYALLRLVGRPYSHEFLWLALGSINVQIYISQP